jgi:rubrerythrin
MDEGREWTVSLAELRYLDQEAASAYDEAVGAFDQDSAAAALLHRHRAAHARHAARIDDVLLGHPGPPELADDVRTQLQEQVWHVLKANGRRAGIEALLVAEEAHLGRYEAAGAARMPAQAHEVVREGVAEEREHVQGLRRLLAAAQTGRR